MANTKSKLFAIKFQFETKHWIGWWLVTSLDSSDYLFYFLCISFLILVSAVWSISMEFHFYWKYTLQPLLKLEQQSFIEVERSIVFTNGIIIIIDTEIQENQTEFINNFNYYRFRMCQVTRIYRIKTNLLRNHSDMKLKPCKDEVRQRTEKTTDDFIQFSANRSMMKWLCQSQESTVHTKSGMWLMQMCALSHFAFAYSAII